MNMQMSDNPEYGGHRIGDATESIVIDYCRQLERELSTLRLNYEGVCAQLRGVDGAARSMETRLSATAMKTHQEFAECIRNMVNGSGFDLTDSPKSFIATVQRLVAEMDAALKPEAYVEREVKP